MAHSNTPRARRDDEFRYVSSIRRNFVILDSFEEPSSGDRAVVVKVFNRDAGNHDVKLQLPIFWEDGGSSRRRKCEKGEPTRLMPGIQKCP